jgi:hypothetical protein
MWFIRSKTGSERQVPKKLSDTQQQGDAGEDAFRSWATNMMFWPTPTKHQRDVGSDFICQIPGERISKRSVTMPGKLLEVPVRSTTQNSNHVKINRSDAELFLLLSFLSFSRLKTKSIESASLMRSQISRKSKQESRNSLSNPIST